MLKSALNWIDQRTGLISAIDYFLEEDIPASAGWHQVFGSVSLFAFLLQVVTGLLMAVNYAPTPGEAWQSLRYIVTEVTAGAIIHGLHHWGASAMIVVVAIHMAQVFLWGAYKKPRETTWIVGVLLFLLTLAFGLSGYLLPWDNRAYSATMVTTRITASAPGGALLLRLLGTDGSSIGRVTFARFYAAHVTLLPLITGLLILFHLILVRRHGVAPAPGDESKPKKKFFPEQVFKDTVAIFLWCVGVALMVAFVHVPLGHVADPTDTSFTPRPEWYFLFLFQFLKLFQGPVGDFIGSVLLPGLAVGALVVLPFIDRGKMLKITQRTGAITLFVLAAIGWTALTARAVATTPKQIEDDNIEDPQSWQMIPAAQLAGIGAFREGHCAGCHQLGRSSAGPNLLNAASVKPSDWLMDHFRKPAAAGGESNQAEESNLPTAQLRALVELVTKRGDDAIDAWKTAPPAAVRGAEVYQANQCGMCHTLNGEGGKVGPALNGVRSRHDRAWVLGHFSDPEQYSPGSQMPPFDDLSMPDLESLTDYLLAIPK
jgi:ubiquinol-cytochrome c reductase cytochrome b subunit